MLKLYDFSVDYVKAPPLIRTSGIRLGWKLDSDNTNVLQRDYRITISHGSETVYDTGCVTSAAYFDISLPSLTLSSRTEYTITVCVHDNHGDTASLSHTTATELLPSEWAGAKWIRPKKHIPGWAPYLRTKFCVTSVQRAVLWASGLGCAEYYLNGQRIDDGVIDPPQTNYEKEIFYRRFDVTQYMSDGGNALCVLLGEGFYAQSRVWGHYGFDYGKECLCCRLEITLTDGTQMTVMSDPDTWQAKYSPITTNNIYAGETYDCRIETPDFALYDSDSDGWAAVIEDETPKGSLIPCLMPPVREIRRLPAISVTCASGKDDGAWIFDLGENIAGTVEYHLPWSPRGAVYVFRYAENLTADGALDMRSIGAFATQCIQQDIYICRGDQGGEFYTPRFSYQGFRYVEITGFHDFSQGYGTMPWCGIVTGIHLSTDMARITEITTSNTDLNRLLAVMDNTYRSNFHGLPEDCPAREKCGWLGDAQVVANYGLLNYDSTASYEKYLSDIRTTREVYGVWQMIAPGKRGCGEASPLWGCAQIIIPYYLYHYHGDREAVLNNWDLMEAWVAHELARSDDFIISTGLGDWCPPEGNDGVRRMPVPHSSTLMFYEICTMMAELSAIFALGKEVDYQKLADSIKESFIRHFFCEASSDYSYWGTDGVALQCGLYPKGKEAALLAALRRRMSEDRYAMPTGIYANKYLVPYLFAAGHGDDAMHFLFHRAATSFGTMLDDGATSIWESPDMKHVAPREEGVASYDHPMHGGFLYFVLPYLAGIRPAAPGFASFVFAPCFTADISETAVVFHAVSGKITVSIETVGVVHRCRLYVPAGVTFTVAQSGVVTVDGVPYTDGTVIGSGEHTIIFA